MKKIIIIIIIPKGFFFFTKSKDSLLLEAFIQLKSVKKKNWNEIFFFWVSLLTCDIF
jgi:hypothetical protein